MKKIPIIVLFVLIFFISPNDSRSTVIKSVKKIKVIDGDTINLNGIKIRFSGIDAPESNFMGKAQFCINKKEDKINCGNLSKKYLQKIILNREVTCKIETKPDQYNRKLGECFIENKSLSKILVRNGYAFDYPKYSKNKFLIDQNYAKKKNLGLWKTKFDFPWVFRKKIRNK